MVKITTDHRPATNAQVVQQVEHDLARAGVSVQKIQSVGDMRALMTDRFNIIMTMLGIMSLLVVAVGALGLMGTMSINVLERRREIGVMRAIGASDWTVMQIFLTEGVVISLLSWEAQVEINGTEIRSINDVYGDGRDPAITHTLKNGEILTHVILPKATSDERAGYFRSIARARAEWALVEASVRLVVDDDNTITMAQVAIGGVAHIPLVLPAVNQALEGQPATEATFEAAAKLAIEGVSPLPQTGYKVPLVYGTVLETLNRAYNRVWSGEG